MATIAEVNSAPTSFEWQETHGLPLPASGILVFSYRRQLQYMNRRACDLIRCLNHANEAPGLVLPSLLIDMCEEIRVCLDDRLRAQIREPFQVDRVVSEGGHRFLLRGYGLPGHASGAPPRAVILIDEMERTEDTVPPGDTDVA